MSTDLDDFLTLHQVGVETFLGDGANGSVYAATAAAACFVESKIQTVNSPTGEQVVSSTTIYADLSLIGLFPPRSRVTYGGDQSIVISTARADGGALLGSVSHCTVYLT